jgi:hypothetical protein
MITPLAEARRKEEDRIKREKLDAQVKLDFDNARKHYYQHKKDREEKKDGEEKKE